MYRIKPYLGTEWIWRFYVSSAMWTQCGTRYPAKRSGLPSPFCSGQLNSKGKKCRKEPPEQTRSSALHMKVERRRDFSL